MGILTIKTNHYLTINYSHKIDHDFMGYDPAPKNRRLLGERASTEHKKARSEAQAGCLEQGLLILKCMRYDMIYRAYIYIIQIYIYTNKYIYIYTD